METHEVIDLAHWVFDHVKVAMPVYEELVRAMEQNSQNGTKVAIREHLNAVEAALKSMPTERLSSQQVQLLEGIEAWQYIGKRGFSFIERVVKEGNYDPVSSAKDLRAAKQTLESAIQLMSQAESSLHELGIFSSASHDHPAQPLIRLHFRADASIDNVVELKKWATEWHEISRGLALASGESPEDVRISSATTGSIIITLATTATITLLIAKIIKNISDIVRNTIEIDNALSEWRTRRLIDRNIETALKERKKSLATEGLKNTLDTAKEQLGELDGEASNALEKALQKLFRFHEKGGEVDILLPPKPDDEEDTEALEEDTASLREVVSEVRKLRNEIALLLEDGTQDAT
ncbi:hypothetical protein [Nitratireductor basaltis]|nr:hypothetical protein [Nitratireductor basaltis]